MKNLLLLPATLSRIVCMAGCLLTGNYLMPAINQFADKASDLTMKHRYRCPVADNCEDISAAQTLVTAPTDIHCGSYAISTMTGCLESANPESTVSECDFGTYPTVWFKIQTDGNAVQLITSVSTNGSWSPVWAVYYGSDCNNLILLSGGDTKTPGTAVPCGMQSPHSVGIPKGQDGISSITTLYVAVSTRDFVDDPDFVLNAYTKAACTSCLGDLDCSLVPHAKLLVTQRSGDRPLDDPYFCPGERVTVCLSFTYDASHTGNNWFHGLIPDFGPGWDLSAFNPSEDITATPPGAQWHDVGDGACAPFITEYMPLLFTFTDENGMLRICNIQCGDCPCVGNQPLAPGSKLPGGWFWSTEGGPGCLNNCSPSTKYGIGSSKADIHICMNLKVKDAPSQIECEWNKSLKLRFVITSDAVTGCWQDPVSECKLDISIGLSSWAVDCNTPPPVIATPENPVICHDEVTGVRLNKADGLDIGNIIVKAIPNPNISGASDTVLSAESALLNQRLSNLSPVIQIQQYEIFSELSGLVCPGERRLIDVTVYPGIKIQFSPVKICKGDIVELYPDILGGTGNYTGINTLLIPAFQWSTGDTTTSIKVSPEVSRTYTITVTDDSGCSGTGSVFVEVQSSLNLEIVPKEVHLYRDGLNEDLAVSVVDRLDFMPQQAIWESHPAGLDYDITEEGVLIKNTTSDISNSPYQLCASVLDSSGCYTKVCEKVEFLEGPKASLLVIGSVQCTTSHVNLGINTVLLPGQNAVFKLLDCDGNLLYDTSGNPYIHYNQFEIFKNVPLTNGSCFKLASFFTDGLLQEFGGSYISTLEISIPQGVPVVLTPDTTICTGQSTTIKVVNAASYSAFSWQPPQGNVSSFTVSPVTTTQYSVTATQSNGCTATGTVTVTVNPKITGRISGKDVICAGDSTVLTASGGIKYLWNTGATTDHIIVKNEDQYTVTVTDLSECITTAAKQVSVTPLPSAVISGINMICTGKNNMLTASGGDDFLWNTGQRSPSILINTSGIYTVTVTSKNCTSTAHKVVEFSYSSLLLRSKVDTMYIKAGQTYLYTLLSDSYSEEDSIKIRQINTHEAFLKTHSMDQKGLLSIESEKSFVKNIELAYEICDRCGKCVTRKLILIDEQFKDIFLPSFITPFANGNTHLKFSPDQLKEAELWVFNQLGQLIYYKKGYDNSLDMEAYPAGVYYYILGISGMKIKRAFVLVR